MTFPERIQEAIGRHGFVPPGARVLVACSAGPDSTALLAALEELVASGRLPARLACAHLDHGLRPSSVLDAGVARALAGRFGVPFFFERADLSTGRGSVEARARAARYAFLERTAAREGFACVATGHTREDQVETVLLARLRGAPPCALGGMPVSRPISAQRSAIRLVRPMLGLSREGGARYLAARGLVARIDPTNLDTRLRRNWVRRELLPHMRRADPDVDAVLLHVADRARAIRDRLASRADARLAAASLRGGEAFLPDASLAGAGRALAQAVLSSALARSGLGGYLGRRGLASALSVWGGRFGRRLTLDGGVTAERVRGGLFLSRGAARDPCRAYALRLEVPGEVETPSGRVRARVTADAPGRTGAVGLDPRREAILDLDRIEMPLEVRPRRPGDRMRPLGAPGSRKIKKIISERGIRRGARDALPLVVSAGRIVWIAGLAVAHGARLTPKTRRAVRLTYEPG